MDHPLPSWKDFEVAEPELAAKGRRLFEASGAGMGYVATVARDGRPRIAPVSPIFTEGQIYLSVGATTPKRYDLANDGRYALHAFLGQSDEEFQVSGRATLVSDPDERAAVHRAIAFAFEEADPIFRLSVERGLWGYWEKVGQPGTYPVRRGWQT